MPEMYGDLVTGLTFTVAFPFFAHKAIVDCAIQNERGAGPIVTCLLLGTTAVCALKSWLYRDRIASYTGYTFLTLFSMAVCYFEWPNRESKSLLLHFAWHLFTTSANISLSLLSKTVMLLVAISAALIVSYASSVYTVEKNLPNILGGAVIFIVVHAGMVLSFSNGKVDFFKATPPSRVRREGVVLTWKTLREDHAATLIVLGLFLFAMAQEVHGIFLRDGYGTTDGVQNLCVTAFFGAFGLVAAGAFRDKADVKKVKKRSEQVFKTTSELLQMATVALNASHTALAVVDEYQRIMLFNPAFQRMCGHANDRDILGYGPEEVLRLNESDALVLSACFESGGQAEFYLRGRVMNVTISPASDSVDAEFALQIENDQAEGCGYVMILKDVTEERALERAIESAQQQASMTQAIMNAIQALAPRLQQPQPVPPQQLRHQQYQGGPNVIPDGDDDSS